MTGPVEQILKAVGCELQWAWVPQSEDADTVEKKTYDGVTLLGAVAEDGGTLFSEVADSSNRNVTVRFLRGLQDEFGDHLHVVRDSARFPSNQVAEFFEDTAMQLTSVPTGSPD